MQQALRAGGGAQSKCTSSHPLQPQRSAALLCTAALSWWHAAAPGAGGTLQPCPVLLQTPSGAAVRAGCRCGRLVAARVAASAQQGQEQQSQPLAAAAAAPAPPAAAAPAPAPAPAAAPAAAPAPPPAAAPAPAPAAAEPAAEPAAAEPAAAEPAAAAHQPPPLHIKTLSEPQELDAVAKLRAEAYYEDDRSRFAASFKKQFAAQEAESLRQRTAATSGSSRPQLCDCLVAVEPGSGRVLGCIDIRLPQSRTGMPTIGVPDADADGCYILNVVVAEGQRGRGVGKRLMRAAMARAVQGWGAARLYTHVEADNEVASRLYKGCGFQEHSSEGKYANASNLGRLVLLMAAASDVELDAGVVAQQA